MNDELLEQIGEFTEYITRLAPDVKVIHTSEIFEDEHANLEIYPPLTWTVQECRDFQRQAADHAVDIHLETGYLILVYVCTPEQQVAEARRTMVKAQQDIQAAQRVLAQAEALDLQEIEPHAPALATA